MYRSSLALLPCFCLLLAATAKGEKLLSGTPFRQAIASPEKLSWAGKPLRAALDTIAELKDIAIVLDRRIDPDQPVSFNVDGLPLEQALGMLAERHGAAVSLPASVVYIGPKDTADVLATVVELRREDVKQLPAAAKNIWSKTKAWDWPKLTTPRQLLDELEAEYHVKIVGKEKMPHDLWPAGHLPPLSLAERLSLVLAGFHVSFEISPDGTAARIVPMPRDPRVHREHVVGAKAEDLAAKLQSQFPEAVFTAVGNKLAVDGKAEVQETVQQLVSGKPVRPPVAPNAGTTKNYTLNAEQTIGALMKALGPELGKKVEFDPGVTRKLSTRVTVNVSKASLDGLLKAVLEPGGLTYEINGDTIYVTGK